MTYEYSQYGNQAYTFPTTSGTSSSSSNPFSNLFGALLSPLTALIGGIFNYQATKQTNQTNREINQQNLDYNTAMTQAQWERDDTAHQRQVADLKAAGLSPLAATQGASNGSPLGSPNPIAMQAPQLDVNTLVQSMLEAKALNETERHNRVEEGNKSVELTMKAKEIEQQAEQLVIDNKKVEETIKYNAKYLTQLSNQLEETKRANGKQEELKKLQIESEHYFKEIDRQTHGKCNYKTYKDYNKYEAALKVWENDFQTFINTFISETSSSSSSSYNSGYSGAANVGTAGAKGFGVGGSISDTEGYSGSHSYNVSQRQEAQLMKFYQTHPMPVFINSNWNK